MFDCFDGTLLKYFRDATAITADPPEKPSRTIAEIIDDIWANRDRDYNVRCLVKRLQRIEKEMALEARDMFAAYIPEGDMGRFAADLPAKIRNDFTATMQLLRNPAFQELLVELPSPRQDVRPGDRERGRGVVRVPHPRAARARTSSPKTT